MNLKAIKERCEKATPGPWRFLKPEGDYASDQGRILGANSEEVCNFGDDTQYYPSEGEAPTEEDTAFICAARTDLPEAVSWIERAKVRLERDLKELKDSEYRWTRPTTDAYTDARFAVIENIRQQIAELEKLLAELES